MKKNVSSEEEVITDAPNRNVCEGKDEASKGKGKDEVEDEFNESRRS